MADLDEAKEIIGRYINIQGGLLECLHALQHVFGYVPKETVDLMAEGFNISRAEVHGVISYYHDFKTTPGGRTKVRICQAEACQAMGSRQLTEQVKSLLGLDVGENNDEYSFEAVYCFGNCALSPNIEINGKLLPRANKDNFEKLLKSEGGQ